MAVIKIVPMPGAKGAKGDEGETGSQGPQGETGLQGPAGADALWSYNGSWQSNASYAEGDVVTYDGQLYYATGVTTLGTTPDVDNSFDLITTKGADGVDGAQGPQGEPGVDGVDGVDGAQGPQGEPGTDGVNNSFEDSWTLALGTNTVSFTVDWNYTYAMWVRGNIPNGIVVWNAFVTVTNSNVPVIGNHYAWNYVDGGALTLTAIPTQIVGTAGSISTAAPAVGTTANTFVFSITNNSGQEQTIYYGYTKV